MVETDAVSKDFQKQVLGCGLTTAEIVYRPPVRHWLLQTYLGRPPQGGFAQTLFFGRKHQS